MERPKVTGWNGPPCNGRARDIKHDEKKLDLARQRKYTKEARAKIRICVDPTIPPCHLRNAVNAFFATHNIKRMVAANIATEDKAAKNNETKGENTPGAIVF